MESLVVVEQNYIQTLQPSPFAIKDLSSTLLNRLVICASFLAKCIYDDVLIISIGNILKYVPKDILLMNQVIQ